MAEADFGSIDMVVCCDGETLIGTVEEVGNTARARSLVRQMFETNFFGPVNVIKAALPGMRRNRDTSGSHIIVVSSIGEMICPLRHPSAFSLIMPSSSSQSLRHARLGNHMRRWLGTRRLLRQSGV